MDETRTLQDIIKTKEIIKNKLLALKRGKQETEQLLSETFKPVVEPLTNLSATLEKLRLPEKFRLPITKEPEVLHDEVFETPIKRRKIGPQRVLEFLKDEEISESPGISPMQEQIKEQFETKENLEQSSQNILGDIAGKYMAAYAINSSELDTVYGIRLEPNTKKFMIGDSEVEIDNNDINIDGKWYEGTPGLYELLTLKVPNPNIYSKDDKQNYLEIVQNTNAHRKYYNRLGNIISQHSLKYKNIIKDIVPYMKTRSTSKFKKSIGAGYPELNVTNKRTQFVFIRDFNKLIRRLKLLLASKFAGHTGHDDEIVQIEAALREGQIIF